MPKWDITSIKLNDGSIVQAYAPTIISASRATDIPAFFLEDFFQALEKGYSSWQNPFNRKISTISYSKCRFIIFWSKNPAPLLNSSKIFQKRYIDILKERNINFYIQFTLNNYEPEGYEPHIPGIENRIDTFKRLSDILSAEQLIWRFDPLIINEKISIEVLLQRIKYIGNKLKGYTKKLTFSFLDIYKKIPSSLKREWLESDMVEFAKGLHYLSKSENWDFNLSTCAEKIDLQKYNISHNSCVDDKLIAKISYNDRELLDFLNIKISNITNGNIEGKSLLLPNGKYAIFERNNKDKGQRALCNCTISKDIGSYHTCKHGCLYCYAK